MKYLFKILLIVIATLNIYCEKNEYMCSFPKIPLGELVKYTGKVTKTNFIADESLLNIDVTFISESKRTKKHLLNDLFILLNEYNLEAIQHGDSLLIRKKHNTSVHNNINEFDFVKLQYHPGKELLLNIKQTALSLNENNSSDNNLKKAISSLQWIEASNKLMFSSDKNTSNRLKKLISKLDTPLKQVYVEVLVIETDVNNGHEFGVSWKNSPSEDIIKACKSSLQNGVDMGLIGNTIVNSKKIFTELTSFVKHLSTDNNTSVVLNQKLLTQENKISSIFEGDTVPFAGSVIELNGANHQTTSNIQYKDIGVALNITPIVSDSGIVTLNIDKNITESHDHLIDGTNNLSGIKTSKTQMKTEVHVPNDHFLILSGMTRKIKTKKNTGVPILRSIPILGLLFSNSKEVIAKKSLIIYVRPHIVDGLEK